MKRIVLLITLLGLMPALAQPQEPSARNRPPGDNVVGKVTSIAKDSLVLAPLTGGDPVTVKIGDNTRVVKDRQPIKFADIKTDEIVFARGNLKDNVMEAGMVGVVNPQMVQMIGQGGGAGGGFGGGRGQGQFNREDLGKKFIAGEVKAINETKLTIARPDGQNQDIDVDENTSFKRGNESITLPDIKAGDFVRGTGELKDGVFVPKELIVGRGQMRVMMGGPGNAPPSPPAEKPQAPAPPKN
jgi:Domain of unknown function (DUF5666)